MSELAATEAHDWPPEPEPAPQRLHRPVRAYAAAAEFVLAGLVLWAAFLAWSASESMVVVRAADGAELVSRHFAGNWVFLALVLGLAAALLVIDGIRQIVLAVRTRPRKHSSSTADTQVA